MSAEEAFEERKWAHQMIMQQLQLLREVHRKVMTVAPANLGNEEESLNDSSNDPVLIREDGEEDNEGNFANGDNSLSDVERDPTAFRSNNANNVANKNTHNDFFVHAKETTQACQQKKMTSGVGGIGNSRKTWILTFWQSSSGTC